MLNKAIAVTGWAGTMSWVGALESAGREAKFGPQAAAVHRQERATHHLKTARIRPSNLRLALARGLLVAIAAPLLPLHDTLAQQAPAAEVARDFDLSAGELSTALEAFRTQSGIELVYAPGLAAGRQARAVSGRMGWRDALHQLLQGSGLCYRHVDGQIVLAAEPEGNAGAADRATSAEPEPVAPQAAPPAPVATEMATVTVTGTRIRGGTTPSPVTTIGSERIREEGFADLGEVIRSVPQNFSGGQNPGVLMGNVAGAGLSNQNITGGSALNLRGLGPDASLTLLNGRRLAYSGFSQAVDISAIPVEAVDRIEIVADGASAIYGSDAVGGVANVLLKREFDGVALGSRYGAATEGGLATRERWATTGGAWARGGLIATYKRVSTDPVHADQRDFTSHLRDPQMILPASELRSGLASGYLELSGSAELRLDALRTERDQVFSYYGANPAQYNLLRPRTTTTFMAPALEVMLANDWLLSVAGSWGEDEHFQDHAIVPIATGIPNPVIYDCLCNRSRAHEVSAEGPVLVMPGGDARVAIGAGYRKNGYQQTAALPASSPNATRGDEASRFAYAEISMPLAGAAAGGSAVRSLVLTAAARYEDYDSFGSVATPKVGLVYKPSADLTLKASWGRSFKAPTLLQRYRPTIAQLSLAQTFGGTGYPAGATVLLTGGGNPDLQPERARTSSVSIAFHPASVRDLELELTAFDVDYADRVVEPIGVFSQTLSNPNYAEFVSLAPTADEQSSAIDAASVFYNTSGAAYDPGTVVALVRSQYVNAASQRIKGLDLTGSYALGLGDGTLTLRGSASWLSSSQRTTSIRNEFDLAGTLHNPAKLNSRIGVVWSNGGWQASAFANYVDGTVNPSDRVRSGSFTTFDASLRFTRAGRGARWPGFELAFLVNNLFNRPPPLYAPLGAHVPPYDSTNYSPVGRYLSVSASLLW